MPDDLPQQPADAAVGAAEQATKPAKPRAAPNRDSLTQAKVQRMVPPATGYLTIWDRNLPGFGVRISSRGRKTWIAMYRVAGSKQDVMESIDTFARLPSIDEARERARYS